MEQWWWETLKPSSPRLHQRRSSPERINDLTARSRMYLVPVVAVFLLCRTFLGEQSDDGAALNDPGLNLHRPA